ncbi:MAG: hypothetical protein KatS3mg105_2813 [Gemmatales bacterium]|nr:MAG: hypothetical protein KatS3mg105_2813 [Gemmatales bacterium]
MRTKLSSRLGKILANDPEGKTTNDSAPEADQGFGTGEC